MLYRGGYSMRTADDDVLPKPLQMVGPRPLLSHAMRYYAHYGHKEFILDSDICSPFRTARRPQITSGRVTLECGRAISND